MNVAKIMVPRACTGFLNEKQTVRQGWEVMTPNGYTAIPVLDTDQHYIGCVSEGDFLRYILSTGSLDKLDMENHRFKELVRRDFCPSIGIDANKAVHSIRLRGNKL